MKISIGVDLANVEMGFPVAPAGEYAATIIAAKEKKKEGKEYPYVAFELVCGCQREGGSVVAIHLTQNVTLHPKYPSFQKEFLVATKFIGPKDSLKEYNTEDLIGRRVKVVLSVIPRKQGEGNMNNIQHLGRLEDGSPLAAILDRLPEGSLVPTILAEATFP